MIKSNSNSKDEINVYDEDILNEDLYLAELHKKFAALKAERKKSEQDAFVLVNRLKLLKGEETKTVKKIEATKKKTSDKMSNLIQAEENLKSKLQLREERERDVEEKKIKNSQIKTELGLSLMMMRENKMRQIAEEARLLKEQKNLNKEMISYLKNEDMVNNKSRADWGKSQKVHQSEKIRAIELEKKQKMRAELEQKLMEEQLLKEQAEGKISDLEQEEIDIMRKIRSTTQVHKSRMNSLLIFSRRGFRGTQHARSFFSKFQDFKICWKIIKSFINWN